MNAAKMGEKTMKMDPRCKRLNELSDRYHLLFRQLAERYLEQQCREAQYPEALCFGDFCLLYQVGEGGDHPVHMAEISRKLNINPSTATRRVNRLLKNGLVTKSSAPDDDRCYDLRVTQAGHVLLQRMEDRLYDIVQATYAEVTDAELQIVYGYLEKCINALARLEDAEKDEQ